MAHFCIPLPWDCSSLFFSKPIMRGRKRGVDRPAPDLPAFIYFLNDERIALIMVRFRANPVWKSIITGVIYVECCIIHIHSNSFQAEVM